MDKSVISEFYENQKILITGASGFIGKVLIWKLLHSCPKLDTIYILMRQKYGKNVQTRVDELLQVPIFDNFKKENPKILSKIIAVSGDIGAKDLGLCDDDRKKLIKEVNIVFHIAAVLKLDANLKDAVNMNTEGTLRLLNLCLEMENLKTFIHTSTAYCHGDIPVMEEKAYQPPDDPYNIINLVQWMDEKLLQKISDGLIKPHPNTYTYSKRLAEKVVADFFPRLPVVITRPSIVIPAWKEPFPGWVDNLNGPTGLMIAAGKGVLRSMLCNGAYDADLIPVDIVCNGLIAVAWRMATTDKPSEIPVFNLTQAEAEPITWGQVIDLGKSVVAEYPFEMVLWYPDGNVYSNEIVHTVLAILFHWIPAYLIDFIMLLIGQKTFLVRVQRKIHHGQKVLQYFTIRQWKFVNDNIFKLRDSFTPKDRQTFELTIKDLDRHTYMVNSTLVCRHYILKNDPASLPRSRRKMKFMYALHKLVGLMFYLLLAYWFLKFVDGVFRLIGEKTPPIHAQSLK